MTIDEGIKFGNEKLKNVEDSFTKVKLLMAYCINEDKSFLVIHNDQKLTKKQENIFLDCIEKLKNNIPLQYITGFQDFYGMKYMVNENVLIPRFDTEILVQEVLKIATKGAKILDMCTGSGILAITINKNVENSIVYGIDISKGALEVAIENNKMNKTSVNFILSDLFENLHEKDFDIIVSNPPYISEKEMSNLSLDVQKEPELALYGGKDGLDFYRKISRNAKMYLKSNGYIFFEIGYMQKESVMNILKKENYTQIKCIKDYNNLDRVVIGKKE